MICSDDNDLCGNKNKQKQQQTSSEGENSGPYAHLHGQLCETATDLNPAGFILVDDFRIPARSMGGHFIAAQTSVEVVGTDPFGVSVILAME